MHKRPGTKGLKSDGNLSEFGLSGDQPQLLFEQWKVWNQWKLHMCQVLLRDQLLRVYSSSTKSDYGVKRHRQYRCVHNLLLFLGCFAFLVLSGKE